MLAEVLVAMASATDLWSGGGNLGIVRPQSFEGLDARHDLG